MSTAYIIMGVSGCGKSTVGEALAAELNCPYYDGDDFHSTENVVKMAGGVPLNDDDRRPWLAILRDLIADHLARNQSAVLACSALKKTYREQLHDGNAGARFVYLKGDFETILQRMQVRSGHYMQSNMLQESIRHAGTTGQRRSDCRFYRTAGGHNRKKDYPDIRGFQNL